MVSIILPNYNHADFLSERIDSIFNQTYQNFEVIILDDASTDNSLELLEGYRNHPKVSHYIINKINTGSPFKQWQKGLELVQGDFVWISESDDYCDLNFLESQLEQINNSNTDIVVAETKKIKNQVVSGVINHPIFSNAASLQITLASFLYCPILNVSAVLFKSELLKSLNEFSNYKLIGDRVFYFEAFQTKNIALNCNTKSYFRKEDNSVSALSGKDLDYFVLYYQEHFQFAYNAYINYKIDNKLYKTYITRFFNRVNNRLTNLEKLQVKYIKLRLRFYKDLKR